jgi:hypothetical protein
MHAEQRALALRVRVYCLTHAPHQILDFEAKRAGASVTTRITMWLPHPAVHCDKSPDKVPQRPLRRGP